MNNHRFPIACANETKAPYNLPNVTADWSLSTNGDIAPYQAWKMNDGLLWYDTTPDNRWTNNQSEFPYSNINITLPRAREIHSVSLAIMEDVSRGGVVDCPEGIKVVDRAGNVVAFKNPWTECVPNALNTVVFADPSANNTDNSTTANENYTVETDFLQVTLSDKLRYTTAVTEIQIWVAPSLGPRYEAEDGLIGTFIGSYEGRATGLNGTIENGGVTLHGGAWVELADVRTADSQAATTSLTIVGGGTGTVEVGLNWLVNQTVTFSGNGSQTLTVDMLRGGNSVEIFQTSGTPFVDAIIVGS